MEPSMIVGNYSSSQFLTVATQDHSRDARGKTRARQGRADAWIYAARPRPLSRVRHHIEVEVSHHILS